jgi:hypothetical protein
MLTINLSMRLTLQINNTRSFSASLTSAFRGPNSALGWILLAVSGILVLTLLWPTAASLFQFRPLHGDDLLVAFVAGAAGLLFLEALKPIWRARLRL